MTTATAPAESASSPTTASVVTQWAYGLIAVQIVVRGYITFPGYFFQDDFAHLEMARRLGLSSDYLIRDYGGHLEVGQYFLIWLMSHVIDVAYWPAAVSILLLQLAASVLLFTVLRELFGARPLILVPLAIYLFTPLSLAWATWWAAALQTLPLQIAMLAAILGVARFYRTRETRWAVVSVLAHAGGLIFWEKAVLIFPALIAVATLVISPPETWRSPFRVLRTHWRLWVSHALTFAAYLATYLALVDTPATGSGSSTVETLLSQTLARMYVPGIFGGPWHARGAENTVYPYVDTFPALLAGAAFVAVMWASFKVNRWRAASAWLLLAGYLTADLALLGLGRADWIGLLARDPRYVADALPITALAIAAAFYVPSRTEHSAKARELMRRHETMATVTKVVAVVVISCLITTFKLAPVVKHEYSYNFTMGVARQMHDKPNRSVVGTPAPTVVSARADVPQMMKAIGVRAKFNEPATEMYIFDGLAALHRMDVYPGSPTERGPKAGCGWPIGSSWRSLGTIDSGSGPVRVVKLGYYSGEDAGIELIIGDRTQKLALPAGLGFAYFVVPSDGGDMAVQMSGPGQVCISDWTVGAAWTAK